MLISNFVKMGLCLISFSSFELALLPFYENYTTFFILGGVLFLKFTIISMVLGTK